MQKEKQRSNKQEEKQQQREKEELPKYEVFENYKRGLTLSDTEDKILTFCQNSIVTTIQTVDKEHQNIEIYLPAYVRINIKNMMEMDVQNLASTFIAIMSLTFYLGKYGKDDKSQTQVKQFTKLLKQQINKKLKVTFQNDFVMNLEEEISTNASDADRLVRTDSEEYEHEGMIRIYYSVTITREFKFGLRSDILFFPLQQNQLNLVTTINPIKTKFGRSKQGKFEKQRNLTIRFNCMNLQMLNSQDRLKNDIYNCTVNKDLQNNLRQLYLQQHEGKQLTQQTIIKQIAENQNNIFFRNIKISFPLRKNSTEFGYYNIVEKQIKVYYTREKQPIETESCYENLKNFLFCRKKPVVYRVYQNILKGNTNHFQLLETEQDRSLEDSFCNTIITLPLLKASLGSIIQLCVPIFFLSFLTLVEFLYSQSTTGDTVRGLKIGASILIVATYINFIYAMRSVIPPTPSWSIFEIAVSILAASSILPILQVIYATNYQNIDSPFNSLNGFFIACFIVNVFLCFLIFVLLVGIKIYQYRQVKRYILNNVGMSELLKNLSKTFFTVWRNKQCYVFMKNKLIKCDPNYEVYIEGQQNYGRR